MLHAPWPHSEVRRGDPARGREGAHGCGVPALVALADPGRGARAADRAAAHDARLGGATGCQSRVRKKGKRQRVAGCEREKTDQALPDRGPEILLIWWKNTNMNITAISDRNTGVNCARNKSFSERISLNRTEPPRKP